MKIAFFAVIKLTSENLPGLEKWILKISNALTKRGHEVSIYGVTSFPHVGIHQYNDLPITNPKIQYYEISTTWGKYLPFKMRTIPHLDADLIYVSGSYYSYLKQILKIGPKTIFGFHSPGLQHPKNRREKVILKELLPRFDGVHILSKDQFQLFNTKNEVLYLENTNLNDLSLPIKKADRFTVIYFSRWEYSKGIDTLAYVSDKIPDDVQLLICGFGSIDLRNMIKERSNVKIFGAVSEELLVNLLQSAHVTIFPSYNESSSLALMESLGHATPVIYRPIPQNNKLTSAPISINLVANTNEDFLNSINKLKVLYDNDPEEYLRQCLNLTTLVFTRDQYVDKLETFFYRIAKK